MKILVVDDDRILRAMLQKVLSAKGDEVVLVNDGKEAWDYYRRHRVSIVITDWLMPKMDGLELCRRIRHADMGYYTYIIVLSGKGETADQVKMLEGGADDFVVKPFDPKALMARVATGERVIRLENEHKKMQSIIAESRDKIRTVFDSLHEEIVTIDPDFRIVSANQSFVNARQVKIQEMIGNTFSSIGFSLFDHDGNDVGMAVVTACFAGKTHVRRFKIRDKTGAVRYKQLYGLPVTNTAGEIVQVILVMRDVTKEYEKTNKINELNRKLTLAIKQINQKNQTLEAALQQVKDSQMRILQSEKMASIGQLAAGVAHEINNPTGYVSSNLKTLADYQIGLLNVIGLYREMVAKIKAKADAGEPFGDLAGLMQRIADTEKSEDIDYILEDMPPLIHESQEGTQRIKKIVNDLKEFSHPGADAKKASDINQNIETTLNIVWNEIKYKATVEKDFGDIPLVWCYPQRINQVFMNILVNAAHSFDENGQIHIKTSLVKEQVVIAISDNGCGIPKENLSKIFDPFFTTKGVGKGTGLGLHLAYNIITDHKGTIEVKSRVGEGTTFTIRLPVSAETVKWKKLKPVSPETFKV